MSEALNELLHEPRVVRIGGRDWTLRPFGVRAVPVMSRLVSDVWNEVMARPDLLDDQAALVGFLLARLPGLVETRIDDLLALLALQTGERVETLESLPLDDFIELAGAALEDGRDFFFRKVVPRIKALAGTGPMSSPPSSPAATAAQTSSNTA